MTDVVEIARKHRALLAAEIARLDRFLRMAAALRKYEQGGYGKPQAAKAQTRNTVPTESPTRAEVHRSTGPAATAGDKALPFIGEEVTAQTVSAVPSVPRPAETPAPAPTARDARPEAPAPARTEPAVQAHDGDATPDHFQFAEQDAESDRIRERIKALDEKAARGQTGPVDIHIGQKLRQRRWMIGMSRQQLGDAIGVELDEIRNYEMGTIHVGPSRMWQIASVLDVPMSYFFEEIEGQSENGDAARSAVLSEAEARMMLHEAAAVTGDDGAIPPRVAGGSWGGA